MASVMPQKTLMLEWYTSGWWTPLVLFTLRWSWPRRRFLQSRIVNPEVGAVWCSHFGHVRVILGVLLSSVYTWTDSTIVLDWLAGNPRRFKTYVGNRVSEIIDRVPPDR